MSTTSMTTDEFRSLLAKNLEFEGRTLSWSKMGWGAWTAPRLEKERLGNGLEKAMKTVALKAQWPLDGGAANAALALEQPT